LHHVQSRHAPKYVNDVSEHAFETEVPEGLRLRSFVNGESPPPDTPTAGALRHLATQVA
jgi:hypothetical protein